MGARRPVDVDCPAMDDELIAEHTDTAPAVDTAEIVDELLIEEISIDGMCGVY
jgi:mycofactocin precursor